MPVELVEIGTSAGIGVVDNVLVELEERGVIKGNMTYAKDVLRIGGAFGGLIYNYVVARPGTTADKVSSALALSALPLAFHSIRSLVKTAFKYGPVEYELVSRQAQVQTQGQGYVPPSRIISY